MSLPACNCETANQTYAVYEKWGSRLRRVSQPTWCLHAADATREFIARTLNADDLVTMTTAAARAA